MSGEQKFHEASQGEIQATERGQAQIAQGRGIERGNLMRLREDMPLSKSDKANAQAEAKVAVANASTAAREGAVRGFRAAGPGGAGYTAVNDAALAARTADGMTQTATRDAGFKQDLGTTAELADQALTGQSVSQKAGDKGLAGLAHARIAKTINRNLKAEQDMDTFTKLGMLGLKGLNVGMTKLGTEVKAGGELGFKENWAGKLNHVFFDSDTAMRMGTASRNGGFSAPWYSSFLPSAQLDRLNSQMPKFAPAASAGSSYLDTQGFS